MPLAKATSAGICPALVAAALLLSGCGGGSEQSSTEASAESPAAKQGAPGGAASSEPNSSQSNPKPAGATGGGEGSAAPGSAPQGKKQGPRIATPKGPAEQGPTPEQIEEASVADIALQSPAILAAAGRLGRLDPIYTCDGKDVWPAFTWSGVPAGTAELVLFAMNLQPIDEAIFFDWAVAGIDPALGGIEAGKLPPGAVVGKNSFGKNGWSLCPPGAGETYMFALYALPRELGLERGFDPKAARKAVLELSGNVGLLPGVYERG